MGEDRSIPDHVNDGVPVDEVDRFDRYEVMLYVLAGRRDEDAAALCGDHSITRLKRVAFINAAINNIPAVNKKMRVSFPNIKDFQGLIDRLRLEVIMRRLDGH